MPTLSHSGNRRFLRVAGFSALLLSTSTGAVMAASNGCRVAVQRQALELSNTLHRKVHHSAATLARWKVGAAAWSKAHHGKVYAGHPVQARLDWKPQTFSCDDTIALAVGPESDESMLLPYDPLPEFRASPIMVPQTDPGLSAAMGAVESLPPDGDEFATGFHGAPAGGVAGAGASAGAGAPTLGPVGTSSISSLGLAPSSPPRTRPLSPKHPIEEATLLPPPVPPNLVPTPEPSGIILLGTGVATLCVGGLRRRLGY